MKKFKEFLDGNESGRFILNPFWLEYILNLFFQNYLGEVWEEVCDTQLRFNKTIEGTAYGIIEQELSTNKFKNEQK